MARVQKIILGIFLFILICFCFRYFYLGGTREIRLKKEGNTLIEMIENFKKSKERLPNSLDEIGIREEDGIDVLYYFKRDSLHYTVSFPTSFEEHKFYYSDSKKWEDKYREMK